MLFLGSRSTSTEKTQKEIMKTDFVEGGILEKVRTGELL